MNSSVPLNNQSNQSIQLKISSRISSLHNPSKSNRKNNQQMFSNHSPTTEATKTYLAQSPSLNKQKRQLKWQSLTNSTIMKIYYDLY